MNRIFVVKMSGANIGRQKMTEKRLVEGLSFEEYLRRNPMPTKPLDNENYKIIEIKECDWE